MLRLGGNTDRQRERVVAAFEKQKTTAEIAKILKTLYHGGNGLGSVSAWYAEDGIHLSQDVYKRQVYTHDPRLMEKLQLLAKKHPDQITRKDAHNFVVPKRCVSVLSLIHI